MRFPKNNPVFRFMLFCFKQYIRLFGCLRDGIVLKDLGEKVTFVLVIKRTPPRLVFLNLTMMYS